MDTAELLSQLRYRRPDEVRVTDASGRVVPIEVPQGRIRWPRVMTAVQSYEAVRVELVREGEVISVVEGDEPALDVDSTWGTALAVNRLVIEAEDRAARRVTEAMKPGLDAMTAALDSMREAMEAHAERATRAEMALAAKGNDEDGPWGELIPLIRAKMEQGVRRGKR